MMAAERSGAFLLVLLGSVLFMLVLYQFAVPGLVQPRGHLSNPYLDPNGDLSLNPDLDLDPDLLPPFPGAEPHYRKKFYFPVRVLERRADFCIEGDDVMVFLHIQKTGGTTFGRHLVQNVRLQLPCDCRPGQKKCTCYRPNRKETWLFSRFSTGWSCGLHADWTELTSCVPGVLDKRESKGNKQRRSIIPMAMLQRCSVCHQTLIKLHFSEQRLTDPRERDGEGEERACPYFHVCCNYVIMEMFVEK